METELIVLSQHKATYRTGLEISVSAALLPSGGTEMEPGTFAHAGA